MTPGKQRFDTIAGLCCLGFLSCWTVGSLQIEYLTRYVDVWTQNFARYVVACLFWLPVLIVNIRKGNVSGRLWLWALLPMGANVIMQTCWAGSFYHGEPGFVMLLNKSSVIWVAGFSIFFFAEERALLKSRFFWLGLSCSITGVVGVILYQPDLSLKTSFWGAFLAVASSMSWAVYIILAKIAFRNIDSRLGFSMITVYMVFVMAALGFALGEPAQLLDLHAKGWITLVTSAIISIALGHVFFYVAIKRIGATIPSMTLLSSPFITFLASRVIFDEHLTAAQLTFGVILVSGAAAAICAQRDLQQKQGETSPESQIEK